MSKIGVVNEIHKNVRVNFPRRHVVMKNIDDLWQADLVDMQSSSKDNSGYKYILAVIDTFSKYAWAYPLKQKNKKLVSQAFQLILNKGRVPKNLQTDCGTEFYNKEFKKLLDKYSINHYSTYSIKKASIAERFIRTLKSKLYKEFSLNGNYKWAKGLLGEVIKEYNNTTHRTIGLKPCHVNETNKHVLLERFKKACESRYFKREKKFKIGDYVRISKFKGSFEKGYTPNWSTEIFKIIKIQNTTPTTYTIEDARSRPILGAFYSQELQKSQHPHVYLVEKILKRKNDKYYVKWLGFPSSENSWIDKTSVL